MESNLLAMGFERSGEGTVAKLPDKIGKASSVENIRQTSSYTDSCRPTVTIETKPTRKFFDPPVVTNDVAAYPPTGSPKVACSSTSSVGSGGGLYGLVKEKAQVMRNSASSLAQLENISASTPSMAHKSDGKHTVERTPVVYFCESKNMVISASSAEDSLCRYSRYSVHHKYFAMIFVVECYAMDNVQKIRRTIN